MAFTFAWPRKALMVSPEFFRIEAALNPHMRDEQGGLHQIDAARAQMQWQHLKQTFEGLGLKVEVLAGHPEFPDMVFCANAALPFVDRAERQHFILSRLQPPSRRGEVQLLRQWADERGLKNYTITDFDFEGAGDAVWNYEKRELWGGYGFRTDLRAYEQIEKLCPWRIHRLKLIDPLFYHLDTAFAVLRADAAAYVPQAFDHSGRALLRSRFATLIEIDPHEARYHLAANCVSVDGRHVVLPKGAPQFVNELCKAGFIPVESDVSEFLKSGGGTFCLKQILF